MSKYIDLEAFDDWYDDGYDLYASYEALYSAPTVDVDKPKGEWIDMGGYEVCKNCYEVKRFPHWNFCPSCGADMREREDE